MTKKKFRGILGIILMMAMMSVMQMLYPLKIALLGLLLLLCFGEAKVCRQNRLLCSFLCASSLLGIFVGAIVGTPYPFHGITVGVLWPIFSLIIVTPLLKTDRDYTIMIKWMFFMHSFLIIYDLVYAVSIIRGTPIINLYPEMENVAFSFYETTSRMGFVNLNTLTFTTPLFFLLYLTHYDFGVSRKVQFAFLLLNLFLLIFSGRRSLMLIFILAPLFTIIFQGLFPKKASAETKKYLSLILIFIVGALGYVYTTMPEVFEGYLFTFTKAFDSEEESTKFNQARMLWGHFMDNPLLGSGAGAEFYEAARGIRQHQFELTYLLKLATGGIIGFTLYIMGSVGALLVGFKYARKRKDVLFICILFAFFFVLLADATNPVLCSFDLMLPLFLVYAKINSCVFNYNIVEINESKV